MFAASPWRESIRVLSKSAVLLALSQLHPVSDREQAYSVDHRLAILKKVLVSTAWVKMDLLVLWVYNLNMLQLAFIANLSDRITLVFDKFVCKVIWVEIQTINKIKQQYVPFFSLETLKKVLFYVFYVFFLNEGYQIISVHLCLFSLCVINIFWKLMAELAWNQLCRFTLPPEITTIRAHFCRSCITNMSVQCWLWK